MNSSVLGYVFHPYNPPNIVLEGYVPNSIQVHVLIASFATAALTVFVLTSVLARRVRPDISNGDLWIAMWFMLCGCIHLFFEGYFAFNNASMPTLTHLFGQLWKEYALSDRRYLTRDSFVVCMETVTAVCWGPLSFIVGWCILKDSPLRYPLQSIVSLGQLYGDVLYYATFFFDESVFGAVYCRPENYYFWAYFVMMNGFWIVIPMGLVIQSVVETTKVFRYLNDRQKISSKKNA
ncbi:Emopamil-binding protein [Whalleya microplaca]|nr:Emopamil-binding protein [Whalleya microplaca]